MIKAVLLDCGGVMVSPTTGDWLVPPGYEEILGLDFMRAGLAEFRKVRPSHFSLLPDLNRMDTDAEEYEMFIRFYQAIFEDMNIRLSREQLERFAYLQVYRDDRYVFFDDVLPFLRKWKGEYKLGIVSDAPPSTRRILETAGVMALMDGATFSCDLGILKPDPRIFESTLSQMGMRAEEAVFVDDFVSKLRGGVDVGMRGVQMRRPMPESFTHAALWEDGPIARDFAELDALLPVL